jgi:hypothetical protein
VLYRYKWELLLLYQLNSMGNECTNMCKNPELKMKFEKEDEKLVELRPEAFVPYTGCYAVGLAPQRKTNPTSKPSTITYRLRKN